MLLLLVVACSAPNPCAGAPAVDPELSAWTEVPVGDGVVCRADPGSLAVDYPGRRSEEQLAAWAASLEGAGWQVMELSEPERGVTDSRWSLGAGQLSLTVRYERATRSTTVYASRY